MVSLGGIAPVHAGGDSCCARRDHGSDGAAQDGHRSGTSADKVGMVALAGSGVVDRGMDCSTEVPSLHA